MRSFGNILTVLMMALMLSFASPVYAQDATCADASCQIDLDGPGHDYESDETFTPDFDPATYERYRLPEGQRCVVDGVAYQCFALEEYTQLLLMDADLRGYDSAYPIALSQISLLEEVERQLQISLTAAEEQVVTLQTERTRLLEQWTEENRLRLEAENRPMIGSVVAWVLAAGGWIAAAILGGVVAGGL